jgi:catechol 2,3-dioxygenase-like lactoylglutathione lyase family enzyme
MVTISGSFSGYSIDDQAAALAFYRDKLGLTVDDNGMGLDLSLPGGQHVFLYEKDDHSPATFTVLNLEVADIDAAAQELRAAGVELERYDGMPQDDAGIMRGKASGEGPDIAWFRDPAGNILSIING